VKLGISPVWKQPGFFVVFPGCKVGAIEKIFLSIICPIAPKNPKVTTGYNCLGLLQHALS
jgi:hypothetical protein